MACDKDHGNDCFQPKILGICLNICFYALILYLFSLILLDKYTRMLQVNQLSIWPLLVFVYRYKIVLYWILYLSNDIWLSNTMENEIDVSEIIIKITVTQFIFKILHKYFLLDIVKCYFANEIVS